MNAISSGKGGVSISFSLRAVTVPDDYPRIAEILTLTTDTPSTVERLAAGDANLPASTIRHRLVAVGPDGMIAAYGAATHGPFALPGRFTVRVFTHPAFRRRGAGSMLWDALVEFTRAQGATSLATSAADDDADGITFIAKRGFARVRHIFESQVDLTEHDGSAYAHVVTALAAGGIRFFTLAEQPGEETERALYALDTLVAGDNPGDEVGEFPPFEEWRPMMLRRPGQRPEFIGIAADGERVVGFTTMYTTTIPGLFDIGFTGVHREYRGRGIALALKVRAAQVALQFGARALRTGNDSRNGPMLAVNHKLGYKRLPGRYEYERSVLSPQIRALAPSDTTVWLTLAHETSDDVLAELSAEPAIFYAGFHQYMEAKIRQGEAFMAADSDTGRCMGIVAFSRKHNRITFLGVSDQSDVAQVGSLLVSFAIGQLDRSRPIHSTVLKSRHKRIAAEMHVYEAHGFEPCGDTVEAGVSATLMERPAK